MINNSLFKLPEIPDFHPVADLYERDEFFRECKRHCIEGMWVGGKWMPPELYYYINFHTIIYEEGIYRGLGLPWLRDIDWEKAYIYSEACGFSGFEKDETYSCHRELVNNKLTDEDLIKLCVEGGTENVNKLLLNNLFKPDGSRKVYIPAREYLQKIHNGDLGKPLYFNQAKHVIEMASRGYGKSYNASGLITHNFLFDGARDYDEYLTKKVAKSPLQTETVVGAIDAKYSNKLIDKVKTGLERLPGSKIITVNGETLYYPSPLSVNYSGSLAVGRELLATNSKSKIQHVTFADNPLAASGGRPNKVFIDEVGFCHNILQIWGSVENTQAVASFKRLTIYALGTGGLTTGGAVTYVQEIFYNPETYGCLVFDDKWENKDKPIGYFVPGTMAMNKFKEGPNFITNEEKALKEIEREREEAKKTKSSSKIQSTIINKPIKPSEIFLRLEGSYFPTFELKDRLVELERNSLLTQSSYKVDLRFVEGEVKMFPSELNPIIDYPLRKGSNMDACIEIFEKPKKGSDGIVFSNRYIISNDPVDDDGNNDIKRSLQSTHVFDTWTDRIVAEYSARTYLAEDYYENVRKLCIFYKAKILYENNKKGLYGYFKNKNSLWMLAETPQILKDQELIKGQFVGNRSLGVNMSDNIKIWAMNLVRIWLEKEAYGNPEKKNLHTIRSIGLLKELIGFSMDINADRVSSLLILMIYKEELGERITDSIKRKNKTASTDPFWNRSFKNKVYNKNLFPGIN